MASGPPSGPLAGLRILEIGHFVAAPFCTRLLADLGADVIKIEPPTGDPVRQWGAQRNGHSVWWSVHGRNKRSVTLDLKHPGAAEIVLKMIGRCDALVENLRPGHLDKLQLGVDRLRQAKPDLVIAHISGFGQSGPYRDRAAFGVIGEAMGGLRYLTNHAPGESTLPPVRAGISIGDSIAGLYAAFGVLAGLWNRDRGTGNGRTQSIDVALTESVFSLMEGILAEYSVLGRVRQPAGSRIATTAPSSAYPTKDGRWLLVAANSDRLFARLLAAIGQPHLASDGRFADNAARLQNVNALDTVIADWTRERTIAEVESLLVAADIPCCKAYTIADCATDLQFMARGMVQDVYDKNLGAMLHPGIVPHMPDNPGQIRWPGPAIGEHTREVLQELAGLDTDEIDRLGECGVT